MSSADLHRPPSDSPRYRGHWKRGVKKLLLTALFISTLVLCLDLPGPAQDVVARLPTVQSYGAPTLAQLSFLNSQSSSSDQEHVSGWVKLDGRQVFQVSAPQSSLKQRQSRIETNLQGIRDAYLQAPAPNADVEVKQISSDGLPSIYVNGEYLMTVTEKDADVQGTSPWAIAEELEGEIPEVMERAKAERQIDAMRRSSIIAGAVIAAVAALAWLLSRWSARVLRWTLRGLTNGRPSDRFQESQWHQLRDIQMRLLPLVQGLLLVGALFWIAGLFPQTRELQQDLPVWTKIPLLIGIILIVAYIGIRLSYALVDRFVSQFTEDELYEEVPRRAQLRVSTITSVVKNIVNFIWIVIGAVVALALTGVDLGVLLASIGVIGLAVSLAAKGLIQGAVNGFFIILEDQFAIGDVVKIGEFGGLVENLNLRITQLRDTEGRLVTIPMSDVKAVANYSLRWSRADLKLPVSYKANIDELLEITHGIGQEMMSAGEWQELILEEPSVLGVEDFGDSAIIIRVWIKTQPMKQWDVAREYRRRFKLAMQDLDHTSIPFPQRDIHLYPGQELRETLDGWLEQMSDRPTVQVNGSVAENDEGNGQHRRSPSRKLQPTFKGDDGDIDSIEGPGENGPGEDGPGDEGDGE
ncbi:MAG: mechanosensitive ion channel family protein [Elainellaceae cyanobacterium]